MYINVNKSKLLQLHNFAFIYETYKDKIYSISKKGFERISTPVLEDMCVCVGGGGVEGGVCVWGGGGVETMNEFG